MRYTSKSYSPVSTKETHSLSRKLMIIPVRVRGLKDLDYSSCYYIYFGMRQLQLDKQRDDGHLLSISHWHER